MTDQSNTPGPGRVSAGHGRGKTMFVAMALAVAVVVGLTGSMLSTALGQGYVWRHFAWQRDGLFDGRLNQAEIDDRIDRLTKHLAIELDATPDQQMKIAGIAKAAVTDLRPMREQAQAARVRALNLLTSPSIDRGAIERLRSEQIELADTASKRIGQALADASDVLTPEQRRRLAEWIARFGGGGPRLLWRRG
jgi:Spy/CpxP family protein refolding chaperone